MPGTVVAKRSARTPNHCSPDPVLPALISNDEGKIESMMKKFSFAAVLFALAILIAAPVAQATTVSEVQSMITQLKGKVQIIAISGKNAESKDRPGLLGQLDGVSLTLDQGKFCNSVTKVRDFQKKVNDMISAAKLNQDPTLGPTGQDLLSDGDAIIAALSGLQTQNTGSPCSN
ncbi:MAG: hypothetical protein V7638_1440 [Acidobacteriota bacterium]